MHRSIGGSPDENEPVSTRRVGAPIMMRRDHVFNHETYHVTLEYLSDAPNLVKPY